MTEDVLEENEPDKPVQSQKEYACANNQELQEPKGYFYGINAISHNMIMYDRKHSRLANGFIFGQSGSGKDFFTKEIFSNLLDGTDKPIQSQKDNRKEK